MAIRGKGQRRSSQPCSQPWYRTKWVSAGGLVVGSAAIVAATAIGAGAQLASSPTASAGPRPTATVSGVAGPAALNGYLESLGPVYQSMENSLANMADALQAQDWNGISTACGQLRASGERFSGTLPSPDSRVTPRIQAVADNIEEAAGVCAGWAPGSQPDVNQLMSHINDARADLKSAKLILQRG